MAMAEWNKVVLDLPSIRIISARKANRREVKDYENNARQN